MKIRVLTAKVGGHPESLRTIDMSQFEQREWLSKHTSWAHHNGRSIATWPADADGDSELMQGLHETYGRLLRDARIQVDNV